MVRALVQRIHVTDVPWVIWGLAFGCLINLTGLSLLWPVNAIYIHNGLHQTMAVAGLVLMVYSGAGLIGSFLGGWLYDRLGATKLLASTLILSCVVILLPAFTPDFAVYIGVMAVFGITSAIPFPVLNAVAAQAWPEGGRRSFNFLYVSNNLGVAIGTALGGVLAARSFDTVFYGIAIGYFCFLIIVVTVLRKPLSSLRHRMTAERTMKVEKQFVAPTPWGGIGILFVGYILAWTVYVQWQATVSVYMQATGYALAAYSLLWTLNGILIFVAQPVVAYVARKIPALSIHMIGGMCLFGLSFVLLLFAHHYAIYVAAMVLTTLGEIFIWPAIPAAVATIAPASRLGLLQGLVGSCATCGRMIGPVLGGILYDHGQLHPVLLAAIGLSLLPVALFIVYHRYMTPRLGEL